MQRNVGILLVSLLFSASLKAQDTLPRFTATARGPGKILVSWHNQYPVVTQISIQRSTDSLKNFTTLITVPDPKLPENGAVDSKAPHPNFFYRLFIVFDNGKYLFTASHRPQSNTGESEAAAREVKAVKAAEAAKLPDAAMLPDATKLSETTKAGDTPKAEEVPDAPDQLFSKAIHPRLVYVDPSHYRGSSPIKNPVAAHGGVPISDVAFSTVYVRRGDKVIGTVSGRQIQSFRDSILNRTKDTLIFTDGDTLLIKPFIAPEVYRVSAYVYIGRLGNIHVMLPDAARKKYSVRFFDENNKLLFELTEIKDPSLIVDKTNFQHAGWFRFELYEGDQLKEKNKLFIPKEF